MLHILPRRSALPAPFVLWQTSLSWVVAVAIGLSAALAAALGSAPASATAGDPAVAQSLGPAPVPAAVSAIARARCPGCGVVEAISRIEPADAQPAAYEFTVRLRDGSTRVSTVDFATASAWAVGDRIMLVGGV